MLILRKFVYQLRSAFWGNLKFTQNYKHFKRQAAESSYASTFTYDREWKITSDFYDSAGVASGHYFHQDLFVAKEIYAANPTSHHDVGSRIDGFVAHLAVFRKVFVFDIREMNSTVPNIIFHQLDIMNTQVVNEIEQVTSLSCLHTAEHFGLGRYGDPINFDGWVTGIRNMTSLLAAGGTFYFSTPISNRQRVVFNAHRIFNPKFLTDFFEPDFEILKTAAVRDSGDLDLNANFKSQEFLENFKDDYACGIWILRKK